ncbi:nucleotide sugar dehydrogenase [Candidatus Bathyarchaeota archaeon]|nr:nucleotide sugar dehydrogenase [Candidatus Bathyarchaeota archaeon]
MKNRQDSVSVHGLGYVGLALCAVWLRKGYSVIGVDVLEAKVRALNKGQNSHAEPGVREEIAKATSESRFKATTNGAQASKQTRIKIISIPIDLDSNNEPVQDNLEQAIDKIGEGLQKDDVVILESSVPPCTTLNLVKPKLEQVSGLEAERDFYLAYSPERIYVGRAIEDIEERYPKVIGGAGPKCSQVIGELYAKIAKKGVRIVSSPTVAEFEKLAEGAYRDVNIALANELAILASKMGIDYDEMADVANSQPFCHLHKPGIGVGGACIPVYPLFLMSAANSIGVSMDLTSVARKTNSQMPSYMAQLVRQEASELNLMNPKIAILGLSFRGGIDDTRLSPTYDLINSLLKSGIEEITVNDPYVSTDAFLKNLELKLTKELNEALHGADIAIIATDHPDYEGLNLVDLKSKMHKKRIGVVDGRHLIRVWNNLPRGVIYAGVGRPFKSNL